MPRFDGIPVEEPKKPRFQGEPVEQPEKMGEFDIPARMALTNPVQTGKAALGLMTTMDPQREIQVLRSNFPKLTFDEDDKGRVIVDASAYGGGKGYLNAPGVSLRDVLDVGFQMAGFTPAGKAAGASMGLATRVGTVGAATGATQAGMDVVNQAVGGTEEVRAGNINLPNVAAAAAGGGTFEMLSGPIGRIAQRAAKAFRRRPVVTDAMRAEFQRAAREQGLDPAEVTDGLITSWVRAADEATARPGGQGTAAAAQQTDEFGIPFTRGQATGNKTQLELEDTLREVRGTRASERMEAFRQQQEGAIGTAAQNIQRRLGGTDDLIRSPNQAGARVQEGIQSRAAAADDAIGEAYEAVGDAYMSPEGLLGLTRHLNNVARSEGFTRSANLTPATTEALRRVGRLNSVLRRAGSKIKPAHLKELEKMRRELNSYVGSAANPTDRRQMVRLKREFDNYLDSAVDRALLSGDEQALDALKEARALKADYMSKFARNDKQTISGRNVKDTAGEYMERIIAEDPTSEQVANWLFGTAKIGGRKDSAAFARRIKSAVGTDAPEWQSIRQAAFLKLVEPPKNAEAISGRQFSSRLRDAVDKEGASFMRELFTPEEIGVMRRFADAVRRAQPDPSNPSRTAYKAGSMVRQTAEQLARVLGWSSGNVLAGVGTEAGLRGARLFGNLTKAGKAASATNMRPLARMSAVPAAGATGAVAARERNDSRVAP